ncbi:hypothetical protein SAMN04487910_0901 [Aquimarina amphilecti]|uniref:Tetratricopeptide repeat-containing protein n=1 Tax=Aquimarina amphilecti TaxID=1038014 RepID=A0A1H7J9X2_AQUAM|nr:hypothetical protein [Aquimarina amphilecti]SEK70085.1 hypothetical protein SAMN04487910_0901 [Aquimarina amphilecti]
MKKNEELFYLIKSLSKSEKRYFRLSSKGGEDSEYLLLFNAIEEQKKYNEALIKATFTNKPFTNQLTTIKNYLKQRILQSLRNYHSRISIQAELTDIMRNVEILFHKGLYTICNSELNRAEKKAINFQQNILLFQIKDWKRKVHQATHPQDFDTLKNIITEQKNSLNATTDYIHLLLANIDPISSSLSHKKTNHLHNKTLKTLHLYRKQLAAKNYNKAKSTIEKILKEWEQKPELLKEYFTTYFSVYNNYLGYLVFEKLYKEAFVRILVLKQKTQEISINSASLIKETLRLYNIELEIHRYLKDLHNTQEVIENIQEFITKNKKVIPSNYWLSFRFQFANIYFQKKDYNNALFWINDILNNQTKKDRKDLITYIYWLNLLTHYELRNGFSLRYLINAIKKHIKKQKNIDSYEKILLKFLTKTVEYSEKDKKNAFKQLSIELKKDPIPKFTNGYIDFNEWIEHRC